MGVPEKKGGTRAGAGFSQISRFSPPRGEISGNSGNFPPSQTPEKGGFFPPKKGPNLGQFSAFFPPGGTRDGDRGSCLRPARPAPVPGPAGGHLGRGVRQPGWRSSRETSWSADAGGYRRRAGLRSATRADPSTGGIDTSAEPHPPLSWACTGVLMRMQRVVMSA